MVSMISHLAFRVRMLALVVFMTASMSACSWDNAAARPSGAEPRVVMPREAAVPGDRTVGEHAASVAAQQVGAPYRFGGSAPGGFDCSGLVHYAYRIAGKRVPRTTTELWREALPVNRGDLQAGDLVFFRIDGKMSHVGLYLGDDRFVHAPRTGRTVSVETLGSDFYGQRFIRAGRPR